MTATIAKTSNHTMKMTKRPVSINSTHVAKNRPPFRKLPLMKRSPYNVVEFRSSRNTTLGQQQRTSTTDNSNVTGTGAAVLDRLCRGYGLTGSLVPTAPSVSCQKLLDYQPTQVIGDDTGDSSHSIDHQQNGLNEFPSVCTNAAPEKEALEANDSGRPQSQTMDTPLQNINIPLIHADCAGDKPSSIKLARRTVAPLKFDHSSMETDESDDDDDDETAASSGMDETDSLDSQYQRRKRAIRFHSYVKVVRIPNRHAYTTKQKRRLWNGNDTIRANSKRNRKEFEWEGWNWHNVIEEEEFCLVDGQFVHPAHVQAVV